MKCIICIGIPASGKSTFAEYLVATENYVDINRDSIRRSLTGKPSLKSYYKKSHKELKNSEQFVTVLQTAMIEHYIGIGKDIIISDTNLNIPRREALKALVLSLNPSYTVEYKVFSIALEEALKRDTERLYSVGADVIYSMYKKFTKEFSPQYIPDTSKPKAVIVDIDGTLAVKSPDRGYFEWSKVGLDTPRKVIVDIVKGLYNSGYKIIVFSGRDCECYSETDKWLTDNGIPFNILDMRLHKDNRDDRVVKLEMFTDISEYYNIVSVIDDRPKVCQMWRDIGLDVIQVTDPLIKF